MAGDEVPNTDPDFPTLARTRGGGPYEISSSKMHSTGRYQVGEPIGRGGMGDILAAHDQLIGRDVAIKRLRGEVPDIMLERFMREACIQGRLDHPAIVPVHELGVDNDGVPFFVMKKLTGVTLAKILQSPDPVKHTRQRLLRAFVEICLAVEFAHTRGYLHRDLKPDNIVLGEFGEVYLIDWGIAKVLGQTEDTPVPNLMPGGSETATRDGIAVGTPGYMSPEQARAEKDLDPRCDVYALGCVLFEILTGERLHPIGEAGLRSAIGGVDARPSLRDPAKEIAPELDGICVKATAVGRDDRFQSARALAETVERFVDGDRDLELRKKLAREQLVLATQAFEANDVTESRRTAMRLAGRALALDPTLIPAAELVGRLMLEPPRDIPAEVTRTIADDRTMAAKRAARIGVFAYSAYVGILLMLFAIGFSAPAYPIAFAGTIVLNVLVLTWYTRTSKLRSPVPLLLANTLMLAQIARLFSPFFIGPGVAAVTAMAFALGIMPTNNKGAAITIGFMSMAVIAPWMLEAAGALTPSFYMTAVDICFLAPGMQATEPTNVGVLIIYTVVLVASAVGMAQGVRRGDSKVRERLHMQAWQLRQLVPIKSSPEDY